MTGIAAIIAAAGQGVRMGNPMAKQFLPVLGKPLIWHTVRAFEDCPDIDHIVLVLPAESVAEAIAEYKGKPFSKLRQIIAGGPNRQTSVRNGLEALPRDTDMIVVHDGVRPLVTSDLIAQTIQCARIAGACIAALPITDTLKRISEKGTIVHTLSREDLWTAQTPQTFKADLLRRAFSAIENTSFRATDEASILEYLGIPVSVVKGDSTNLKVTTPADLKIVEVLLKEKYESIQQ